MTPADAGFFREARAVLPGDDALDAKPQIVQGVLADTAPRRTGWSACQPTDTTVPWECAAREPSAR